MASPKSILAHYWGHPDFRGSQAEIVQAALDQKDVLALLPTGGGKSICYQVPALAQSGICIVVSPLIALIQDQVAQLKAKGIKALALTGGLSKELVTQTLDNAVYGKYDFLYLSPERLLQEEVQLRVREMDVCLIAIDEAHCISQWGQDFRPAYRECHRLREWLPETPFMALTATATAPVVADIKANLKLQDPLEFKDSFLRKNIAFSVVEAEDKQHRLIQGCSQGNRSTIVYVRSRRLAESLTTTLQQQGIAAQYFHGGLNRQEKWERLQAWLEDKKPVMVATNAFGMGVDKPDVRLVVHYQIPDSLESYFQEAGRAGRDGQRAKAVLLVQAADQQRAMAQFLDSQPDLPFLKLLYRKLNSYFQVAYAEGQGQSFPLKLSTFSHTYQFKTSMAYNALKILDQYGIIALSDRSSQQSSVQFTAPKQELFTYMEKQPKYRPLIQILLRTYGGIVEHMTKINSHLVAQKLGIPEKEIEQQLVQLDHHNIISYQAASSDLEITFLVPREDDATINSFRKTFTDLMARKAQNMEHMLSYTTNHTVCRNKILLDYFGEHLPQACGICDICTQKQHHKSLDQVPDAILKALQLNAMSSQELCKMLPYREHSILESLKDLLEDRKIKLNEYNQYIIG